MTSGSYIQSVTVIAAKLQGRESPLVSPLSLLFLFSCHVVQVTFQYIILGYYFAMKVIKLHG